MGNSESNDRPVRDGSSTMSSTNVAQLASAARESPSLARSDTTIAQDGSPSPSRRRFDAQPPSDDPNGSLDASTSSANSSFPLSESALPACFDTSGDLQTVQLSHFFPLPPTKLESQSSPRNLAAANSPSTVSVHKSAMSSLNESMEQASLQETLDALWAPPKTVPVRISAPVSPSTPNDRPLIDFTSEPMPALPSTTYSTLVAPCSSQNSSFDDPDSSGGGSSSYLSGDGSAFDINVANRNADLSNRLLMLRENTLTQAAARPVVYGGSAVANGLLMRREETMTQMDMANCSGSSDYVLPPGEDEPIKLPPTTYADAANIATKYPELASKVLHEPLATPSQPRIELEAEETTEHHFVAPPQEDANDTSQSIEIVPAMPKHTPDQPNWALAPDDPEPEPGQSEPKPPRRGRDRSRRDRDRDYNRRQSTGGFEQNQNEFEDAWQYGRGERPKRRTARRYTEQSRGYDGHEECHSARNGSSRRDWSQEPSFSGNDGSHDLPPHLRPNDSMNNEQPQRLPTRPSLSHMDSLNASAPVVDPADDWTASHDSWSATGEQPTETRQASLNTLNTSAAVADPADEWTASHDPRSPARNQLTETRRVSQSQGPPPSQPYSSVDQPFRLPGLVQETDQDSLNTALPRRDEAARDAPAVDEWSATHDPWAVAEDENHAARDHQSHMLDPCNKHEAPSSVRGGGSPFRDRMNDVNPHSTSVYQNDRSTDDHFSANVLDVRAPPSQAGVADLAASRAREIHNDRRDPERTRSSNQESDSLPVEFNYFLHSDTIDWTRSGPTKATQNSFSPSQNLSSPACTPTGERSTSISAPVPRPAGSFNYQQGTQERGGFEPHASKTEMPPSNSFVLGSTKTDTYDSYPARYMGPHGGAEWGPGDSDQGYQKQGRSRGPASGFGGSRHGDDYFDGGSPYASRGRHSLPSQAQQYSPHADQGGPGYETAPMHSRTPKRTSYGARNFVLPPLDEY
ncbi:hypothetical protein B0H10DRAFT_1940294 [Mycena sp. CBHHK59/15]|nr:hypothetical protein B0H10DRAFT_1940294 [Mycena sp. CBHHK59/15]